jgi:tripartite-type tricarboxylate transporter receptor subunit TctC
MTTTPLSKRFVAKLAALALTALGSVAAHAQAWEPSKPIEFIVPAGTGGGADQMARFIQGVVAKNNLTKQPIVVVNKSGGAGAEGFLSIKGANADPHKIIITLSNLFTTPLATGVPFNWRDLTPVSMLALDQFILWTNTEAGYKSAQDYVSAVKAGDERKFKMGGTGSKQEDQILTAAIERVTVKKFTYIPYDGGGKVAVQLTGKHVDSTVNNPIEAVSQWKDGKLAPLCIFDSKRSTYTGKVTADKAWSDIPTCREEGLEVEYLMLRGIFMAPGVTPAQVAFFVGLLDRVRATPEWEDLMQTGAFNTTTLTGPAFVEWLTREEERHRQPASG